MKAAIWTGYGPPEAIELREVPMPVPDANEVRIRIAATTVTAGDVELRALRLPFYLRFPIRLYAGWASPKRLRILGQDLAGTVESVGADVTRFKPGDEVFAATGLGLGAHAEFVCLREQAPDGMIALRPSSLSAEDAATLPFAAFEAFHFLRKTNIRPGEKVLVNGAGGSVGTFAVQIAKAFGAEVTAVDRGEKLEMLRSIGADHVIDFTQEDFAARAASYDVVLDVVAKRVLSRAVRALRRGGRFLAPNPRLSFLLRAPWIRLTGGKRIVIGTASHKPDVVAAILALVEAGKLKPVIGRRFRLDEIVDAHRYGESREKIGNVAIAVP